METTLDLTASTAALALGLFVATSPLRAALIWSSERLERLAPQKRTAFLRVYRAFGILLCLAGVLLALDSVTF
jgi:hypothetical protein